MAKKEEQKQQTFGSRMKDFGGGNFMFLSSDGEAVTFIVVGLPELIETSYQKKKQQRIGVPIVMEDGFTLFIMGKRLARKLSRHEKSFNTNAFMAVRHGAEGDTKTTYTLTKLPEAETFKALCVVRDEDFTPDMITDAVKEAQQMAAI